MNSVSAWPGATRLVCSVAVLLSLGLTLSAAGAERLAWQGHETRVMFVAFSPVGKRLVSGSYDSSIKVWDAGTGKELATLQEKGGYFLLESMAISSVGQVIASGKSTGGFVTLWDLNTYKLLHQLPGHK